MKKNIRINLCGRLFSIDEDAYEILNTYERSLRNYFKGREGGEEIADDLENRIAELMDELKAQGVEAVSADHVQDIIHRLGAPQQIARAGVGAGGETDETAEAAAAAAETAEEVHKAMGQEGITPKRLYRNPKDKKWMGVLSGFAAYFGGDVLWWRVGYVAIFILTVFAMNINELYFMRDFMMYLSLLLVISYLVMAVLMPVAVTPEERLRMKGQAVTPENLAGEVTGQPVVRHREEHLGCIGGFVSLLSFLLKIILFLFGLWLVVMGLGAIIFLLTALILPGQINIQELGAPDWFYNLLPARGLVLAAAISALVTLFIIVFALVYALLSLLGMRVSLGRWLALLLIFLGIIGVIATGVLTATVVSREIGHQIAYEKSLHNPNPYPQTEFILVGDDAQYKLDTVTVAPNRYSGKEWLLQNKGPVNLRIDSSLVSDCCVELSFPRSKEVGPNHYLPVRAILHPEEGTTGPFSYEVKLWGNFPDSPLILTLEGEYVK